MRTDRTFSDDEEDMATAARKAAEANSSGEIKHALISSRAADIAP